MLIARDAPGHLLVAASRARMQGLPPCVDELVAHHRIVDVVEDLLVGAVS